MATVHRHSFTRLSGGANDEQLSLNIIFIHGLRGHPRGTWETGGGASEDVNDAREKSRSGGLKAFFRRRHSRSPSASSRHVQESSPASPKVFWPEEFLAPDIPQARVWTYGYDADVIGGLFQANNKNSISQHGRDLSVRIEREIDNRKPIAFVVHSLGGIILKDAIRRSEMMREQTKLIMFLGTPHRGSAYAGWGQIASNLTRLALQDSNKKILSTLEVNNEILDNIHEEFKTIAFKGTMRIHSFQEAKGISGMKGLDEKVVDDFSSKLDLPGQLEAVESIDANHMQMARYSSKDDEGYRAVSGVLKSFIRQDLGLQLLPPVTAEEASSSDALFMVPFSKDDWFIGRENVIAEIARQRIASQTHTRVALVGLGGVGKSQIAIEYAYRMRKIEQTTLVFWIHASNPTRFKQGYRDIADRLRLPGREDPKVNILNLVHVWLSDVRNGRWLMILDNVDDDSIFFGEEDTSGSSKTVDVKEYRGPLEGFLPQTPNGTVLITSRNKTAAVNLVGTHGGIIEVEPMEEDEALALLQTRVPYGEWEVEDAKALVHALERIPLAITHAAAYIKARAPYTTMAAYLELFRESDANQVRLLSKKEWKDLRRDHSIRHAVIATWQISFTQIEKTQKSAADLLALMSMFDKQGIPRWLIQANTNKLDFEDALSLLLGFSLVRMQIGEQALEMHRLVQLSMRTWLSAENELDKWMKTSVRSLNEAFPSGEYETWSDCKMLLPHVKEVMSHETKDREVLLTQAKTALNTGWYLYLRGEYKAAEGFLLKSKGVREKFLGPTSTDTLFSASKLGLVLESLGRYEEADAMHVESLKGLEKALGKEHLDTLGSVSHLGLVLERKGKYTDSEAMHRRALKGYEKVLGLEHSYTLTSVNNLGLVLESQGKHAEAEVMHRRALEGYEKALGKGHIHTLTSMNNLGSVLESQGKYEEAEAIHRRALAGREQVLGLEHPHTLSSVNNLGSVLESQGKDEEAEARHRQALATREKVLGPHHPDTLTSVYHLAFLYHRQNKQEALGLYQRAYNGYVNALGPQHPITTACLTYYQSLLRQTNQGTQTRPAGRARLEGSSA